MTKTHKNDKSKKIFSKTKPQSFKPVLCKHAVTQHLFLIRSKTWNYGSFYMLIDLRTNC